MFKCWRIYAAVMWGISLLINTDLTFPLLRSGPFPGGEHLYTYIFLSLLQLLNVFPSLFLFRIAYGGICGICNASYIGLYLYLFAKCCLFRHFHNLVLYIRTRKYKYIYLHKKVLYVYRRHSHARIIVIGVCNIDFVIRWIRHRIDWAIPWIVIGVRVISR